jgi:hypothetical protein
MLLCSKTVGHTWDIRGRAERLDLSSDTCDEGGVGAVALNIAGCAAWDGGSGQGGEEGVL